MRGRLEALFQPKKIRLESYLAEEICVVDSFSCFFEGVLLALGGESPSKCTNACSLGRWKACLLVFVLRYLPVRFGSLGRSGRCNFQIFGFLEKSDWKVLFILSDEDFLLEVEVTQRSSMGTDQTATFLGKKNTSTLQSNLLESLQSRLFGWATRYTQAEGATCRWHLAHS